MNGAPAPGARLCALSDIESLGSKGFEFREGEAIFAAFVVRRGDAVFGYLDRCPHAGWPLAMVPDRYLTREGDLILCSGHGALFKLEDGLCIGGPCGGKRLAPWPVRIEGEAVIVA